jgi:hypothetical protein
MRPDEVVAAVSGRFADDAIDNLLSALQRLVEAEGWDPERVAGGAMKVTSANVVIEG